MATIRDLNKSISEMSDRDLLMYIQDVRARRRIPLEKPKRVTRSTKKKAKPLNLFEAAKGMSSDMKTKLLKELLGNELS